MNTKRLGNFMFVKMCSKSKENLSIISSFAAPITFLQKTQRPIIRCGVLPAANNQSHRSDIAFFHGKSIHLCVHVDSILASILWTVLNQSEIYRLKFTLWIFNKWKSEKHLLGDRNSTNQDQNTHRYFRLQHTKVKSNSHQHVKLRVCFQVLYGPFSIVSDLRWCKRLLPLVIEVMMLSDLMSWLSTLGGAYSSLGEQSFTFSEKASHISRHQLLIASRLNNPVLTAQCKVFMAMSMVQQGHLKAAIKIIRQQYASTRNGLKDQKLEASCKAVWNKIRYVKQLKVKLKSPNTSHVGTLVSCK